MKEVIPKGCRSITKETLEPEVSKIIGEVPAWLVGRLIRNGPAKWDLEDFTVNHVFDGYNMLTKFEIRGGESGSVSYTSKFLQSEAYKKANAMQKPVISEYGTRAACADSKKSVFARVISTLIPEQTDNCPFICSTGMGLNPIVIGDTGYMFELDRSSLECISRHDPVKELGIHCQSSHPLIDQKTGYTYNIGISLFSGAKWSVLRFPPGCSKLAKDSIKKCEIITTFACRNKISFPWLHSFGMSQNYLICIDQPSFFNVSKVISSIFSNGICPKDMNEWKPEQKNRFYFIHKETGKVVKTEILSKEAFFFYHFLNCFELGDNLVIDVFCMPNFNLVENQTIVNLRGGYKPRDCDSPTLNRFVIPLIASDIKKCSDAVSNLISGFNTTAKAYKSDNKIILEPELLSSTRMEFSTINKTLLGRPLRYVWSSGAFSVSIHHHKIFKFDIETKNTLSWEGKEYQFVGEPTFVPSPEANDEDEDEGILINVVTNMEDVDGELDFVLFLDAKTLRELGRAYFKADIPAALHGVYLSE